MLKSMCHLNTCTFSVNYSLLLAEGCFVITEVGNLQFRDVVENKQPFETKPEVLNIVYKRSRQNLRLIST